MTRHRPVTAGDVGGRLAVPFRRAGVRRKGATPPLAPVSHCTRGDGRKGGASAPPPERLPRGFSFADRTVRRPTDCAVRETGSDCERIETAGLKPRPSNRGEKSGLESTRVQCYAKARHRRVPTDFRIEDTEFCTECLMCGLVSGLSCIISSLLARCEYYAWKGNCSPSGRACSICSTRF